MDRKRAKKRADILLVEQGLAESRERAQALIMEGLVYSDAQKVLKPGAPMSTGAPLDVRGRLPYVSRGGIKLAHALDRFSLEVSGLTALDVGASTGGFTDCLLQRGARGVVALDVGHGQLDYRLRQDPRVAVVERVNARYPFTLPQHTPSAPEIDCEGPHAGPSPIGGEEQKVDLAVIDVSFISVTKVIPSVAEHVKMGGFIVVLVKPQFEAKRGEVGRGGVIKDPGVHSLVLGRVIRWVVEAGDSESSAGSPGESSGPAFRLRNLAASPILGDAGNREFFLLLEKSGG